MPSTIEAVQGAASPPPSPGLPADAAVEAESYAHLVKRFFARKDDLVAALSSPEFYVELLFIGIALAAAGLIAAYIQRRVKTRFLTKPPQFIDAEFITKPLSLLGPFLAMVFLTLDKLVSDEFLFESGWVDAAIQLSIAYMLAKCVLLVVRSRPVAWFIAVVIMIAAAIRAMRFMKSASAYLDSMAFEVGKYHISMLGIVHGVVVLVVVFWIASVSSHTLESYLRRGTKLSYNTRELVVKCFKIFVYFTAFVITLSAVGVDLTAFAVFGGALGVGLGLGLQKLTGNFLSSVTLLMEKSIKINDLIEVGGYTGWVRQLNMRYVLLETFDGREVMIPNEVLVSTNLTNWTHTTTLARVEIKAGVDYDSDAEKACALMLEAAHEHPLCLKEPAPTCYLREFGDNGINFTLTFWISDIKKGRNGPQSEVMFAILRKFRNAGIHIPHPLQAANG